MLRLIWTTTKSKIQGHEPIALHDPYLINLEVMNMRIEHMVHFVDMFFANILQYYTGSQ